MSGQFVTICDSPDPLPLEPAYVINFVDKLVAPKCIPKMDTADDFVKCNVTKSERMKSRVEQLAFHMRVACCPLSDSAGVRSYLIGIQADLCK